MIRIRLAFWYGDHAPGAIVDIPDDELPALQRDGRVEAVLGPTPPSTAADSAENQAEPKQVRRPGK